MDKLSDLAGLTHAEKDALIHALGELVTALREEVVRLAAEATRLQEEVAHLRGQLAKNSRKSSIPSSAEGLKKTKSMRKQDALAWVAKAKAAGVFQETRPGKRVGRLEITVERAWGKEEAQLSPDRRSDRTHHRQEGPASPGAGDRTCRLVDQPRPAGQRGDQALPVSRHAPQGGTRLLVQGDQHDDDPPPFGLDRMLDLFYASISAMSVRKTSRAKNRGKRLGAI
jgi:hypothetical protein